MGADFHAAPKPVRLTCRYMNGTVVSYVARALSYDDPTLQVLSAESFEPGIQLNVLADFLGGIRICRVASAQRSSDQPAYFEINLKLQKIPPPPPKRAPQSEPISDLIPIELVQAGREFADALEQNPGVSFARMLGDVPPKLRPGILVLVSAALVMRLQDKGMLDVRHLIAEIETKE